MTAMAIRECSSCGATNIHTKAHCLICQAPLSIAQSKSNNMSDSSIKENTSETRICSECKQMIDSDASYCSNCGAVIEEQKLPQSEGICPACKEPVDSDSAYCSQCGQLLQ